VKISAAQLRKQLDVLLVIAETIYTRVRRDPTLGHEFIQQALAETNTLLNRGIGVGPRELWAVYETHAKRAKRQAARRSRLSALNSQPRAKRARS
jgi:hypothetical protein